MSNDFIIGMYSKIFHGLVWFDSISTTVGYLKPNHIYTYILDIYDL